MGRGQSNHSAIDLDDVQRVGLQAPLQTTVLIEIDGQEHSWFETVVGWIPLLVTADEDWRKRALRYISLLDATWWVRAEPDPNNPDSKMEIEMSEAEAILLDELATHLFDSEDPETRKRGMATWKTLAGHDMDAIAARALSALAAIA
jgi:hypothetical protein